MIRISPSLLQKWDDVKKGAFNTSLESLQDYILGVFTPSAAMRRGTAYHKLLEEGGDPFRMHFKDTVEYWITVDGEVFKFSEQAAQPALNLREVFSAGAHEVWGKWETRVEGEDIICWMRIDLVSGLDIHEFKTSSRPKKYVDYLESYQWKMYLLGFPDALRVNYHIFTLDTNNTRCDYSRFEFEPYAGMEVDVLSSMGELVAYLKTRPDLYKALEAKAAKPLG